MSCDLTKEIKDDATKKIKDDATKKTADIQLMPSTLLQKILKHCNDADGKKYKNMVLDKWLLYTIDPFRWLVNYDLKRMCGPGMYTEELRIPDDVIFRFFSKHSGFSHDAICNQSYMQYLKQEAEAKFPSFCITVNVMGKSNNMVFMEVIARNKEIVLGSIAISDQTVTEFKLENTDCFVLFLNAILKEFPLLIIDAKWFNAEQWQLIKKVAVVQTTQYTIQAKTEPILMNKEVDMHYFQQDCGEPE